MWLLALLKFLSLIVLSLIYSPRIVHSSALVTVDVDRPENNGPVHVYDVGQFLEGTGEHKGYQFYGYAIVYPMDIRYVLDDPKTQWYSARVSSTNKVLLQVPAWDYNQLKNRDSFQASSSETAKSLVPALDNAHDKYEKDQGAGRNTGYIELVFPQDHELSAKIINANAGEDDVLELMVAPIKVAHQKAKITNREDYYAVWCVVSAHLAPRKKGKREDDSAVSDASKLLASLGYGN